MDYEADRLRRNRLFAEARRLIRADPGSFSEAGRKLVELFPAERSADPDPFADKYGPLKPLNMLSRITHAVGAAVAPRGGRREHADWFDFDTNVAAEDGPLSACMTIMAILLAADPKANEIITPEMCELGALPMETGSDTELGRAWIDWAGGEWKHPNDPPPKVLARLESAIGYLESIALQANPKRPTDEHPALTLTVPPSPNMLALLKAMAAADDLPHATIPPKRLKRSSQDKMQDEAMISVYIKDHPDATRDAISKATKIARAHVSESQAWILESRRRKIEAKAKRISPRGGVGDPSLIGESDDDE